jgi:hypothetical protein
MGRRLVSRWHESQQVSPCHASRPSLAMTGTMIRAAIPEMTPLLFRLIETSSLPLRSVEADFAADSSGFSTSG